MRALVAFLLSFVLVGTIGALILPDPHPRAKPKLPAGSAPIRPTLDFLPEIPSLAVPRIDDTSKRYEQAWRLLKAGRWRAAERAYLQIVIRSPHDQKGMQGLVILQRLFANEDPTRLQEQAEAYRRAIAEGRSTENQYTPREMELLAEASLLAVNESTAEQNLKLSAHSRVAISSDLLRPISPPHTNVVRDPVSSIKERISQVARSLRLAPAKPGVLVGVLVVDTQHVAPSSIARTPRFELPGGGKPSGGAIDEVANPAKENLQGGATDPGGDTSVGGPTSAGSQSNAGVNDSSREGGGGNSGSSSDGSGGATGNGGAGGASAGSGSGGGSGTSAGGAGSGAGGTAGGSGSSAGKEGSGKGGSEKGGGGKGGKGG
jgi:hypothetical protein